MSNTIKISGKYRLQVRKDGIIKTDTGWFNNLITDVGMNKFGSGTLDQFTHCVVGTGNRTPAFSDVSLESRLAVSSSVTAATIKSEVGTNGEYSVIASRNYEFLGGSAAGNVSEVGIGYFGSSGENFLTTRALVRDINGEPTTITVLPGEELVVNHLLIMKVPSGDFTNTLPDGTNVTIRACNAASTHMEGYGASYRQWVQKTTGIAMTLRNGNTGVTAYQGDIGTILSAPSGTSAYHNGTDTEVLPYVQDSFRREMILRFASNIANWDIRSIAWGAYSSCWQAQFDPPIAKRSPQVVKIKVSLQWGRG